MFFYFSPRHTVTVHKMISYFPTTDGVTWKCHRENAQHIFHRSNRDRELLHILKTSTRQLYDQTDTLFRDVIDKLRLEIRWIFQSEKHFEKFKIH